MKLNEERSKLRDVIIWKDVQRWSRARGGIIKFRRASIRQLEALLKGGFLDLNDRQSDAAPTTGQILEFIREHPKFIAHGYATAPTRQDCRISLEGVERTAKHTKEEEEDFKAMFSKANVFIVTPTKLYCWYD